jgi:hypothetical protein
MNHRALVTAFGALLARLLAFDPRSISAQAPKSAPLGIFISPASEQDALSS